MGSSKPALNESVFCCKHFFQIFFALPITYFSIDTGDDGRISKKEFCSESMKPRIEKWTGPIKDMEAEFDKIDTNGGGQILFKVIELLCEGER